MTALPRRATVIIPTHDHGETLRYPLASLKRQTLADFQAYVIGDGVPEALKPTLRALVAEDPRFHFLDHPKHARRGEPYRHAVLQSAADGIVGYLCDRDIWLPEHLERMWTQLQAADYTHALPLHVLPEGRLRAFPIDLGFEGYRALMCSMNDNRIPFSCFAHRLSAYHGLAEGWATTPGQAWTDLHMFRKFFADPALRGVSGLEATAVTFPSPPRKDWTAAQRLDELAHWWQRLDDPAGVAGLQIDSLRETVRAHREESAQLSRYAQQLLAQVQQTQRSALWRTLV